jgi:hypothetical protein
MKNLKKAQGINSLFRRADKKEEGNLLDRIHRNTVLYHLTPLLISRDSGSNKPEYRYFDFTQFKYLIRIESLIIIY